MYNSTAQKKKEEEEEEKKRQEAEVVGRQQKTQPGANKPTGTTSIPEKKDYNKMADETIRGKYGNGNERKQKLGSDYGKVQNIVNQRLGSSKRHNEETSTTKVTRREEQRQSASRQNSTSRSTTKQTEKQDTSRKTESRAQSSIPSPSMLPTAAEAKRAQTTDAKRIQDIAMAAGVLPGASDNQSKAFRSTQKQPNGISQLGNIDQYVISKPSDFSGNTIGSREQAENDLYNSLYGNRREQLKQDAANDSNVFRSLLGGAGSGALGTLGDLAGIAEKNLRGEAPSVGGMSPDEIYNKGVEAANKSNIFNYNAADIGGYYDAYKEYVLGRMETGDVTPQEIQNLKNLDQLYTEKVPAKRLKELGADARAINEGFASQNPISNFAGQMAPMVLANMGLNMLGVGSEAMAAADKISNPIGRFAAKQGINLIPDLITDTGSEMARNINEGKSKEEILKDAAQNVALNAAANVAFDYAPKGIKAIADRLNGSNVAKQGTEEAAERIIKESLPEAKPFEALTDPYSNVANDIITPSTVDNMADNVIPEIGDIGSFTIGGKPKQELIKNNGFLNALRDSEYAKIADMGGSEGALDDAFGNIIRAVDSGDKTAYTDAMAQYRQLANANGVDVNRALNRLDRYVEGNVADIDTELLNSITTNIDTIDAELKRLDTIGVPRTKNGTDWLSNAHQALDEYESAVLNGGDVTSATDNLNRALGNLDNQAKKVEGYDGAFSKWKGGGTARGDLYSNSSRVPGYGKTDWTDDMIDELNNVEDNYHARPANQIPEAGVIPETSIPKTDIPEVEAPKKVSQTYTNTGKRGGGWNEEEYTKYTDPKDYLYETKSEADSVARAEAMRAEEGREAFKERVFKEDRMSSEELDGLMMEWRELTEEARAIEANGGDASQLWDESNRVFRKIREQSTNNAQALQALAKWSRNTPEGMLAEAENIVNGNVKVEKGELQKQLDKFAKGNKQQVEFSPDFQKQFLELAEEFKKYDPDSREAKDLMGRMGKLIDSQVPKKLSQKVQTWLMDSMLGNFRTLISRNAGGNLGLAATEQVATRPLAAGIDSLVSLKTGKRTQAGFSRKAVGEYLNGMKKGLADEIHDLKTGLHTARTGENTLENAIGSNQHVFKNKILDKFDSLVKNGLSMGDRPFYEATYKQTLGDYYRLRSKMGLDVAALTDDQFKEYAETAAHLNALAAVYQNDSKLAKGMLDLKNAIGQISQGTLGVDVLSQFSMPFVKTPANVIDRAIDYSPVGALRNTIRTIGEGGIGGANFDQNRFVNETARNIIGTGITAGGAGLAYANRMSGSYSDDADEKKAQQDAGMQEYALNVPEGIPMLGGKQVDIGWMPIVGSNLVAGAAAYDAYKNGEQGSNLDNLYAGIAAGGNELFGQAAMQGAQRLFGGSNSYNKNESLMDNAKNVVAGGFSQAIPSLARQIAQVADPYKRDVGNSNEGNYELNQILNALPYFRQNNLVPKVDSSGNPVLESQGRDIPSKIIEDMILPGRVSEVQYNRLDEEAMALSEETGNKFSYMPKAVRKNVEDESRKLTNDEWFDYQVKYGQDMTAAGEAMINNELYANMDSAQKEAALQDIYTAVKSSINNEYKERSLTGAAKVYANEGLDAAIDYVIYGNALSDNGLANNEKNRGLLEENGLDYVNEIKRQKEEKAAINTDGNSSVTQDEILDYLNKGDYSNDEAQKIWNTYKNSNSKKELQKNSNGEWELSGGTKKTSSNSKKTSSTKKAENSEKFYTGNPTLDARIKAKQKAQEEIKTKKTETTVPEVGGNWTVESNGKSYDLKNTKTYQRAQSAGWSDSDFLKHFHGADADHGGTITKAEAKAYIDALDGLSRKEKHDMFEILRTRKSKNPY